MHRTSRQKYELAIFYISVSDVIKRQTTFSFVCAAVLAIKMSFGPSALK